MNCGNSAAEGKSIHCRASSAGSAGFCAAAPPERGRTAASVLILLAGLLISSAAAAEPRFISHDIDVPVRRGAGDYYKIIKMAKPGDKVELLEEKNGWVKVQFADSALGWLPQQLVTTDVPAAERVKELMSENEQLLQKNNELSAELTGLKTEVKAETKEVQDAEEGKLAACIADLNAARAERRAVEDATPVFWFLGGAGVLALGWLLGRSSSDSRRKRNRLL